MNGAVQRLVMEQTMAIVKQELVAQENDDDVVEDLEM
jgi:hypothetical protein